MYYLFSNLSNLIYLYARKKNLSDKTKKSKEEKKHNGDKK